MAFHSNSTDVTETRNKWREIWEAIDYNEGKLSSVSHYNPLSSLIHYLSHIMYILMGIILQNVLDLPKTYKKKTFENIMWIAYVLLGHIKG